MTNTPKTIYLKDYQAPAFWIDTVDLVFDLYDDKTIVESTLKLYRNQNLKHEHLKDPLILPGQDLKCLSVTLDNQVLEPNAFQVSENSLTIKDVPDSFTLKIVTEIHPEKNTTLMGLYRAQNIFCTQCESEGFRRMTFYPDRPDVMAKFTTTLIADKHQYPVLLSNGNCIEKGDVKGDVGEKRHFAKWQDPFKKPCYLFALVAGNLVCIQDHFVTRSNRLVSLEIYVERDNQDKCQHALSALKKAMKWDEEAYGREYDLDSYMIVAVNDFNMGAMENKGLNIFNSKYILARAETATDMDYYFIDAVVGHEYFHNWSGNRITCRDWFQLSLKEGLTVFREHQFSSDITKSTVSLIENAMNLRARQFAEDASPLAHAVRPESYMEINNFYTATVYEKGAEVIRMIQTLLGREKFRQAMDLYFERYDGQAVTIEDFVRAMEDSSKVDLTQFKLWYSQAGTPVVEASGHYNETDKSYTLNLKQNCPPTFGQPHKHPMHIPIAVGLLNSKGEDCLEPKTSILSLKEKEQTFRFDNIKEKPYLSLLRNFSAPIKLQSPLDDESLAFLLANDTDDFNRWDAGQQLTERLIFKLINAYQHHQPLEISPLWMNAYSSIVKNNELNLAFKALLMMLPSTNYLIELMTVADPDAIFHAKKHIVKTLTEKLQSEFLAQYSASKTPGLYRYNTADADKRTYKNLCLRYLMELDHPPLDLALKQWRESNNMTDTMAVLNALSDIDCKERQEVLNEFYHEYQHDPLVIDKWLRVQAMSSLPNTLEKVKELMHHKAFDIKNPNKVYSLIGGFGTGNPYRFHDKSGAGYEFLSEVILKLDSLNPQVAARMIQPFIRFRKFDSHRQGLMLKALEKIQAKTNLSKDLREILTKCLEEKEAVVSE